MRIIAAILHVNGGTPGYPSLRSAARTQAESLDGDLRTYPSRPHRMGKYMVFQRLVVHLPGYALSRHRPDSSIPGFDGAPRRVVRQLLSIPVPLTQPAQEMFAILQDYEAPDEVVQIIAQPALP